MQELYANTTFKLFLKEIEALGFTVSDSPKPGSLPYGVIGGRSNARWWLVPLTNRNVTTSGLALFQPILTSAKILKTAATTFSAIGLSRFWAKNIIHIACPPVFSDLFKSDGLHYAFFTGTDCPHRKAAVQIMDQEGRIKGFAKVTKNTAVKPLLKHETEILNSLNTLDLKTALIPKVLFCGEINGAEALITDSLKTAKSKTVTTLKEAHIAFLRELAEKSAVPATVRHDGFMDELRKQYDTVAEKLTFEWQQRLEKAMTLMAATDVDLRTKSLSHGDFTPWNTFFAKDRLYVFDWEYAQQGVPPGYDLIHFHLSLPKVKRQSVHKTIGEIRKQCLDMRFADEDADSDILLLCYLCGQSMRHITREPDDCLKVTAWDGEKESAVLTDTIIERMNCVKIQQHTLM